ncbi:O-succinylbenzoic acid--CoA ligase [Bibersteinia trehalosi USDA-ARS-USMARC-190]|uniref:O-succinylbenzoic acid--CoA ligase n=1 Tax=Bibersteinia trehalosi USDA-ARS-USMARC-190 TaxID=1263832 RepID=W0R5J6_BIBTR|nr:o-succinylbenzoate--CoA ligase [Bibersteinia trehalosi]AHG86414.1 O-succinylbenzoic acid--CoA ligase [Bibersteinia trehalosi USDA-ARS-USMARC-190]
MTEFPVFPPVYWANQIPQQTAIVWKKGNSALFSQLPSSLSWRQFYQLLAQTSHWLQCRHIPFKDKIIAYSGAHRLAGLLCYLSVIAEGGRILVLNPNLPSIQQKAILADNRVDLLLQDNDFVEFSPNLTACNKQWQIDWDLKRPATFTLTSGSSGKPKGVVHSLFSHLLNAEGVCRLMQFEQQHSWLLSLPLFHVSGQGIVWRWLLRGASLSLCEEKADFYPLLAKTSHASLVPTQLQRYLYTDLAKKYGQKILLGGSYIPAELISAAQQVGITTFAGYGMTEMASTICAVEQETDNVGKPLLGRLVKIIQDQIYLQSDCLALGYWQAGRIEPLPKVEGWFATKDKGAWTADGKLIINGRLDNMFISGGENIQPEQIEQVLYASMLVQNVLVIPQDDAEFGQRPVAFVQFIEDFSSQAVEKLQNFAKQYLEKFKQPIAYFSLDDYLTSTNTGIKISRKGLQDYLQQISNR